MFRNETAMSSYCPYYICQSESLTVGRSLPPSKITTGTIAPITSSQVQPLACTVGVCALIVKKFKSNSSALSTKVYGFFVTEELCAVADLGGGHLVTYRPPNWKISNCVYHFFNLFTQPTTFYFPIPKLMHTFQHTRSFSICIAIITICVPIK